MNGRLRRVLAVALLSVVLAAVPGRACDEVLQALLDARGRPTEFDASVRQLSTRLNSVGFAARGRLWPAAQRAFAACLDDWRSVRGRFTSTPPPQFADDPAWGQHLQDFDRILTELGRRLPSRDFEHVHGSIKAAQSALVRRYMWQKTGPSERAFEPVRMGLEVTVSQVDELTRTRAVGDLRRRLMALVQLCNGAGAQRAADDAFSRLNEFQNLGRAPGTGTASARTRAVGLLRAAVEAFRKQFLAEIYFGPAALPDRR